MEVLEQSRYNLKTGWYSNTSMQQFGASTLRREQPSARGQVLTCLLPSLSSLPPSPASWAPVVWPWWVSPLPYVES